MDEVNGALSRRTLFAVGGIGAVALAGMAGSAEAAASDKSTPEDKANLKLVKEFCNSWNDPDKAGTFLTADASVRMVEDQPALVGPAAVVAGFKGFMSHGEKISVQMLSHFAKGPVVVNHRIDTLTTPGKPDQAFKVVGVFVIKGGKIKEWADYLDA